MAKAQALAITVNFASVIWFKDYNFARLSGDYGTDAQLKTVHDSLVSQDWLMDDNGIIKVEALPADLVERAINSRLMEYEGLKNLAKLDPATKLIEVETFELLYCDANKKIITPQYLAITANRRSTQVFKAKVERRRQKLPIGVELPVIVMKFANTLERIRAQVTENEQKMTGYKEMGELDRVLAAQIIFQQGGTEADVTREFKRGTAQKLWGIVRLDARWPNVEIINRMKLEPTNPRYIGNGLDKEVLRNLVIRSNSDELAAFNDKQVKFGKEKALPADESIVETYVSNPKAGGRQSTPTLKRETKENLAANSPNVLVKKVFEADLANNTEILEPFRVNAAGFNMLYDIILAGDYPPVELILAKIVSLKNGERQKLINALLEITK